MPHENTVQYVREMTAHDHMAIFLRTHSRKGLPAEILKFCVEYRTLLEGRWRKVLRYDNSHGIPHRHRFDWHGEIGEPVSMGRFEDSDAVFNKAKKTITEDYETHKEHFVATKSYD